jgi:hypothetical protein
MKTLLAAALLASTAALAQSPFEIRFYPGERVYAYPLDENLRYRSVQLQNAVVINRTGDSIALAAIEVGSRTALRDRDAPLRRRSSSVAKAGHMLQSSGHGSPALPVRWRGLLPPGAKLMTAHTRTARASLVRQMFGAARRRSRCGCAASPPAVAGVSLSCHNRDRQQERPSLPAARRWRGRRPHHPSHHRTVVAQEFALDLLQLREDGREHGEPASARNSLPTARRCRRVSGKVVRP